MKKTLQDLLAAGKTAEVLSQLQQLIPPETGLHQLVIQLSARFAENERRRHSGTRTDDALGVELNKINEALVVVIGEMERGGGNSKAPAEQTVTHSKPTFSMKNILYFIAAAIASVAIWYTFQWYKAEPDNREPLPALLTGVSSLLLLFIAWRLEGNSEKPDSAATMAASTQTAEKIYNIEKIKAANFGNQVEDAENLVIQSQIDAGGDVHVGPKTIIEQQFINYGDKPIARLLTNPPFNSEYFIGRNKDLEAIENNYQQENLPLVLVNGEGGIGKTTLAAKYWYAHEARYRHLAWLFADAGIGAALISLAARLHVDFDPRDDEKAQIAKITEALNELEKPCLLVFDNANDGPDLDLHYGTLHQLPGCHIVVTSRTRRDDIKTYAVGPLDKDDVVRLFRHHYTRLTDAELPLLHDILQAVGHNTLVAELLAKNLALSNKYTVQYSLEDLLADLQKKGLLALKNQNVKVMYGSDTLRTATPTDIIGAMYDLAGLDEKEQYLLSNLAVLPAENIAYDLLATLLGGNTPPDEHLRSLEEKGWLEYSAADNSFKISPVVQEITKSKNAERLLGDCAAMINILITGLDEDNRHMDNYQIAAVLARLGETVIHAFPMPDDDVATLCQNIGNYHKDTGSIPQMMAAYQKMVDIFDNLCKNHPDNADFKNGLAISYSKLGSTHTSLGNLDRALTFFEEYNRLEKELYAAYPTNVEFKNGLAISYEKLGSTHTSLGNLDRALTFFEERNKIGQELYAAYPTNVSFKNGLAISYSKLGSTHTSLGNLDRALTFFEEYNRLEKELYAAYPMNVEFKNGLAISYNFLGNTYASLGNLDEALVNYENYKNLSKELFDANPSNVKFKNDLAISYSKLGETHTSLGNLDRALIFFEDETKLFEELYAAYPTNVSFKNGLAVSWYKLGEISLKMDEKEKTKAKDFFQQAKVLWQELVRDAPQYVQFQRFLKKVEQDINELGE